MRGFTEPPRHPYSAMWLALIVGCTVASGVAATISVAHQGIGTFGLSLYVSLLAGAAVLIFVATPLMWVLLRRRVAGPMSAKVFGLALTGLVWGYSGVGDLQVLGSYCACIVIAYVLIAYRGMFSNNRIERPREP